MKFLSTLFLLISLIAPQAKAESTGPRAPASCRAIVRSKLGEALRERAWELSRARTLLERAILAFRERCGKAASDLNNSEQLKKIADVRGDLSRANAKMQDLSDDYLLSARDAIEAAHALQETECEERLREERLKVENFSEKKQNEVHEYMATYCR